MVLAITSLPAFAVSEVTLYGQVKNGIGLENIKVESLGQTIKPEDNSTNVKIHDYASRIGFKGSEDLGNGLKTIWQVEQFTQVTGPKNAGWSNRETFVGLESDSVGTIKMGFLRNVFDSDMRDIDPWEYDFAGGAGYNGLAQMNRMATRMSGSVRYDTPNINGFRGMIQYATEANQSIQGNKQAIDKHKGAAATFLGLSYQEKGFFAKYGFGLYAKKALSSDVHHAEKQAKDAQVHRVIAGYKNNGLYLASAVQYTRGYDSLSSIRGIFMGNEIKDHYLSNQVTALLQTDGIKEYVSASKDGVKRTEAAITASYTAGAWTPRATYAHAWDIKTLGNYGKVKNTGYDQFVMGADYALSKRTTLLLSASWLKQGLGHSYTLNKNNQVIQNKDSYKVAAAALGMRHLF